MTSEKCIKIIVDRLTSLVDSGQLNATYNQSENTISFYVNDISIGERPLLTLRVSDHRPTYQKYIRPDVPPPSSGIDTNVSIEFYKPKYNKNDKVIDNKVNYKVSVRYCENDIVPFVINSYNYKPELLNETDVDDIYKAILAWIYGGINAMYKDPFENTDKAAIPQAREAVFRNKISTNISVDKDGNYVSANGDGVDYISENKKLNRNRNMNKKLIRLTESDLHRIVKESVNRVLNEIGNTSKGQYILGRAQARRAYRNGGYNKKYNPEMAREIENYANTAPYGYKQSNGAPLDMAYNNGRIDYINGRVADTSDKNIAKANDMSTLNRLYK